jgi:glycosyltransferase involved in cell wall biosynthesis
MKIGFDAKRAFMNTSGLGNYARSLLKSLHTYHGEGNKFHLYAPKVRKSRFYQTIRSSGKFQLHTADSGFYKHLHGAWRSYGVTPSFDKERLDIYHGLSNELPFNIKSSNAKSVVTIHDLIFVRYPHLYPWIDRKIYDYKFRNACDNADKIIAVSQTTKQDLIDLYNVAPQRIEVIYQCANDQFLEVPNEDKKQAVRQKYSLPPRFLLYVGTIEERKNLLTVLKAVRQLKDKDVPLVIIGRKTDYMKTIQAYITKYDMNTRIQFLGTIDNNELPYFYQLASVFIYPSIFEGFGIPVLEALLSSTPVITSNVSSLPEAAGKNSILVNPTNDEEIAEGITKILNDDAFANRMRTLGLEYAQQFHPQHTSTQLMQLYKSITN